MKKSEWLQYVKNWLIRPPEYLDDGRSIVEGLNLCHNHIAIDDSQTTRTSYTLIVEKIRSDGSVELMLEMHVMVGTQPDCANISRYHYQWDRAANTIDVTDVSVNHFWCIRILSFFFQDKGRFWDHGTASRKLI